LIESFNKFRSEVKERINNPTAIHCNYILHNPVFSNHVGNTYNPLEQAPNVTNVSYIYHPPFEAYKFPNATFPSGLNFNFNNANITPTTRPSTRTDHGLESPVKDARRAKGEDLPQFGYKTPSCAPTRRQDLGARDSRKWTEEVQSTGGLQQKDKLYENGVSPYAPEEMGCLDLFKHFVQTPIGNESLKPSVKNKILLSTPTGAANKHQIEEEREDMMEIEGQRLRRQRERLVICSENMFQNQNFVKSLQDFLETEILPVNLNNDVDGLFYLNNNSCVVLFRDCEDGEDYQKAILNIVKILIRESLKNSNILVIFLVDDHVLKREIVNARKRILQIFRALKMYFANFSCNIEFGYPSDMRQLQRYIERFWISLERQQKRRVFDDEDMREMKRMFQDYREGKHVIWDMMWKAPSLNVIAIVEVCFVMKERRVDLKGLINYEKDMWDELFEFLNEQQRDILYSVFHINYSDIKKILK